jgi:hypothetical protein
MGCKPALGDSRNLSPPSRTSTAVLLQGDGARPERSITHSPLEVFLSPVAASGFWALPTSAPFRSASVKLRFETIHSSVGQRGFLERSGDRYGQARARFGAERIPASAPCEILSPFAPPLSPRGIIASSRHRIVLAAVGASPWT